MNRFKYHANSGITLVELLIVLVIVSTIVSISTGKFASSYHYFQVKAFLNETESFLSNASQKAQASQSTVSVNINTEARPHFLSFTHNSATVTLNIPSDIIVSMNPVITTIPIYPSVPTDLESNKTNFNIKFINGKQSGSILYSPLTQGIEKVLP